MNVMNFELFVPNNTALCQLHRVLSMCVLCVCVCVCGIKDTKKDGTVHAVGILKMD